MVQGARQQGVCVCEKVVVCENVVVCEKVDVFEREREWLWL